MISAGFGVKNDGQGREGPSASIVFLISHLPGSRAPQSRCHSKRQWPVLRQEARLSAEGFKKQLFGLLLRILRVERTGGKAVKLDSEQRREGTVSSSDYFLPDTGQKTENKQK